MILVNILALLPVLAQEQGADNRTIYSYLVLIIILIGMTYFMSIRPQKQAEEAKKKMIEGLNRGDSVVLFGGIHGKIVEFRDNNETVVVNIAKDTNVTFNSSSIEKKK
jgi:preprotein translocase subunit YajC